MIDFTSFGKLIPDSVQLHYSLSTASVQLPYSLNSYRSLYPQNVRMNRKFVCGKKGGESCAENATDLKDRLLESCGVRSLEVPMDYSI